MVDLYLSRVDYHQAPALEAFKNSHIFQTLDWLNFLSYTQNAEPVIAVVKQGNHELGRFSGLIVEKFGMRILGSPFPGWTTSYMGFNLPPSVSKVDALRALESFAFHELDCVHIEIMDRNISLDDFRQAGYQYSISYSFEIDLAKDKEQLFSKMSSACRRCIRKADKSGVHIEIADDLLFADDYYVQCEDVFAKQGLVPPYHKERVKALIEYLLPSGNLLLLRAKDKEKNCIATGIFPAFNNAMYFWGGASWRAHQNLRPNELVQWSAMLYWKSRGITKYDMGGGGDYKRKYGVEEIAIPWGRKSRYPGLENLRNLGKNLFSFKQKIAGLGKN